MDESVRLLRGGRDTAACGRVDERPPAQFFERIARRAGLSDLSRFVHNLRRYFATALFRAGVNPRIVQEFLGHADLTTTTC
jgi:site-specific recombinase XerD